MDNTAAVSAREQELERVLRKVWGGVVEMRKDARTDYALPTLARHDFDSILANEADVLAVLEQK